LSTTDAPPPKQPTARSALYAGTSRVKAAALPREVKGERHKLYGDSTRKLAIRQPKIRSA